VPIVRPGHVYAKVQVGYGKSPVGIVPARGLIRPVRIDQPLVQRVVTEAVAPLPVRRGQPLGEIRIYQGPRMVAREALVAERTVERPGVFGRAGYYAGRTVHHMWGWFS
jgi:hypothetical protein